jgi:DNA-binding transcriptional LysR family regulator
VDRLNHLARWWSWLPQFRAIAEAEHLPTAAARLHVTPPALSRTLKRLEEEVGHPLFHRHGGRLQLTDDGRRLLEAVRLAMRLVDEAEGSGRPLAGPLWVAAGGVSQTLVARALAKLVKGAPELRPHLLTPEPDRVLDQLRRGELDLVVASFTRAGAGVRSVPLGSARSSVWCGPLHPLYGKTEVDLHTVARHPFVGPPAGQSEGWPAEIPRDVRWVVDRIGLGVEIVAASDLLAVLPDVLAESASARLHRLPLGDLIPLTPIVAHHLEPLAPDGAVARALDAVVAELP